jgi:hypothetical protein
VAERLKEAPASIKKKGLTANSLQRKAGTAPKNKEQKNPQLLCAIGDCIICGYFHGLKKMVAEKELLFYNNPLAASD